MNNSLGKWIAPVLWVGNLGVVIYIWLQVSGYWVLHGGPIVDPLISIANLLGLVAFYLFLWQLLLIDRVGWIERYWGHDRLSRLHHRMGLIAIAILVLHPILIVLGYNTLSHAGVVKQFLDIVTGFEDVLWALIAYILFLGIIFVSLWIVRKHLRYEWWYSIHVFLYLGIVLASLHQLPNGRDLAVGGWIAFYWQAIFYLTLATAVYYRFIRPTIISKQQGFRVVEVKPETADVTSVIITGKNLEKFPAQPGQFIIVRFLTKTQNFWLESHPFSLSEMPSGKRLRMSIKASGDFTKKIPQLPVGTEVIIEGPLGRFTPDRATTPKIAMIAGGIGITPLRSMFEHFSKNGRPVDLLYAARSNNDFALKSELDALSNTTAKVHYLPEDIVGRLTPELIKQNIPDITDRDIFLCGPPPMMKAVRQQLIDLGVPKQRIMFEKFQLG